MQIESRIAGIPCLIDVESYEPIIPGRRWGHIDDWEPDEGGELVYTICDRRGREAPWLQRKASQQDINGIEQLIIKEYQNEDSY